MAAAQMKVYNLFRKVGGKVNHRSVDVGDKDAADAAERMLVAYLATHPQ